MSAVSSVVRSVVPQVEVGNLKSAVDVLRLKAEAAVSALSSKQREQLATGIAEFQTHHEKAVGQTVRDDLESSSRFHLIEYDFSCAGDGAVVNAAAAVASYNLARLGFLPGIGADHQIFDDYEYVQVQGHKVAVHVKF